MGTDLFGEPVLPRKEGRGRPEHEWTLERSNRVLLALVRGLKLKETAKLIGVDVKTLRKHYFRELEMRDTAVLRMEMRQLERLNAQAEAGNVAAEKELARQIERLRMRDQVKADAPAPTRKAPLGKKAAAEQAAIQQRGLYEPPAAPTLN